MTECELDKIGVISGILMKALFLLPLLVFFLVSQAQASTKTVSLPLSIDYQLLKSIVIKTAYTDHDQTAILLNENGGCTKVTLSAPSIQEENSQILFETKVNVMAGTYILNNWKYSHGNISIPTSANGISKYICMLNRHMLILVTVKNKYRAPDHLSSRQGIIFNEKLVPFTQ